MTVRKITQIADDSHGGLYALSDDGIVFHYGPLVGDKWSQIESIPQPPLTRAEAKAKVLQDARAKKAAAAQAQADTDADLTDAKALGAKIVALLGAGKSQKDAIDAAYEEAGRVRGADKNFDLAVDGFAVAPVKAVPLPPAAAKLA